MTEIHSMAHENIFKEREKVRKGQSSISYFFFQAEDGIRDLTVTGVQTCALPIFGKTGAGGRFPKSDAHRAAIGTALKGRIVTPEWREKLRQAALLQWERARVADKDRKSVV